MRLFQNSGLYPSYVRRLRALTGAVTDFEALLGIFLNDRFGASHFLLPVLRRDPGAFFTNGDDEVLQQAWARQAGLPASSSLEAILRSQIEAHGAEVFYNLDPLRYGSDFLRTLPGCVRRTIAWRAAPSPGADLSAYDAVVCNFPGILRKYERDGLRTAYFSPAHDPVMDEYSSTNHRPLDVVFFGSYSRHHTRRAELLEAAASLADRCNVALHLDQSRLTRLAESALGHLAPLGRFRRPKTVRRLSRPPAFGRELYTILSSSKIVLNVAIDMAGEERGNMRCWEALGLGCLMVSDTGHYPQAMVPGESHLCYSSPADMTNVVLRALADWDSSRNIALQGNQVVRSIYSKQQQMDDFESIVARLS